MRKSLWLILSLLSLGASAQVSMTVQLPPEGVFLKSQLWNIILVSAEDRPVNVRIALRVTDLQSNEPAFTGMTRTISLQKGAKQLQLGDVMPVQYEYLSPLVDRSANGVLTAGNFLACYNLIVESSKGAQPGEDCISFAIAPLSPPLLNSPANQSAAETRLPQFTWLPPAPLNLFTDLNYEMILTELHASQSPEEAVQQNIPVYRAPRLKDNYINYPASGLQLDTAKTYAWTVIAKNGRQFSAQTEVWTFRVKGIKNETAVSEAAYVQLKKELDGSVTTTSRLLHYTYTNETGEAQVKFEVIALDAGNEIVQKGTLNLQPGNNLLQLELGRKLNPGTHYLFRLLNKRQEQWQMKFIIAGKN